ncbi:hypothetical protein NON20_07345 [Synechocystis sp. B12]|nr:hypothetical protein NON20_07345 [Synechocystis sp. B12]
MGAIIGTYDIIGIPILLAHPQRELCALDEDLIALGKLALANRDDIKTVVGIGLAKNASPITIVRRFLEKLGFGIQLTRTKTVEKNECGFIKSPVPRMAEKRSFKLGSKAIANVPAVRNNGWRNIGKSYRVPPGQRSNINPLCNSAWS